MSDFSFSTKESFEAKWHRRLIVLATVWFFGWLLALAPAQMAARLLHWVAPQLELDNVDGSLWHGSARQAYLRFGEQRVALGKVEWLFNAWSLLWLHPSTHISATWGDQLFDTQLRINPGASITLRETRALFPVELLKLWAPVPARGAIGLNLRSVELSKNGPRDIDGIIDWRAAQWQWGERWLGLGDYRVQMRTEKSGAITGELSGEGDLALRGAANLDTAKHSYQVEAKLSASRGLPEEFRNSLIFLLGAKPIETKEQGAGAPIALQLQRQGSW